MEVAVATRVVSHSVTDFIETKIEGSTPRRIAEVLTVDFDKRVGMFAAAVILGKLSRVLSLDVVKITRTNARASDLRGVVWVSGSRITCADFGRIPGLPFVKPRESMSGTVTGVAGLDNPTTILKRITRVALQGISR